MQIYPLGLIIVLIWIWIVRRDLDRGVQMVAALFPFGMFSIITIGGFSLIADDFIAAVTIGLATVFLLIRPGSPKFTISAIPLLLFAIYSAFASIVLVRVFTGKAQVFAFNRLYDGERVSVHFSGSQNLLAPGSANVSQLAYVLLAVLFFILASSVGHRKGREFLLSGLYVGAILNLVLAFLDTLGLDGFLAFIRTADYSLLNELAVAGLPRIIGGFAEAAEFGAFATGFGSFLLPFGLLAKRWKYTAVGAANILAAAMSLSSTAIIGLAVFAVTFSFAVLPILMKDAGSKLKISFQIGGAAAFLLLSIILLSSIGSGGSTIYDIFDRLILSKSESVSGMERLAMAKNGIEVFWVSWGLGAGVGTVLVSGYGAALLAAVGIPGTVLMIWFYWLAFFAPKITESRNSFAARRASQVFFVPSLAIAMVSSVSASPGMMLFYVAAIAVCSATEVSGNWSIGGAQGSRVRRVIG